MPDELWMEVHDIVQKTVIKTIPKNKKCKRSNWLSEETLQIAVKRGKKKKRGGVKGNIYPFEFRFPKNRKERKERLPQQTMQRNRGKEQNGKD